MTQTVIGLLHPGEMGAAVAATLRAVGHTVLWASEGRSSETATRAHGAGLEEVGTAGELARRSDVILSICPPHAAMEVARSVAAFRGVFVDANAISPGAARAIGDAIEGRFVDGGIIGPPPREPGATRLYLAGSEADTVAELFGGTVVDARVISKEPGAASALKMAYAAWTKGTAAMLLAIRELARAQEVEPELLTEWRLSLPELVERSAAAARSADAKGWRWVAEMEEIASTFESVGLPDGFHRAAAEIFRRGAKAEVR
jgi:3-hydroxyisobutyrate dehydrogenase-like beta-hydroxyacid dehydrogenase